MSLMPEPTHVTTDILIIGSGGAGMYAAVEAARSGASVLLLDRSLIGRGGATVMAQMTVAVALGEETPDHWSHHFKDTLEAGRGLCDERLARLLCEDGPEVMRQMDDWGVGWARKDGHIAQAFAPGHDRPRCAYVDFLNTGPAVSKTLRTVVNKTPGIRKAGDLLVTDLVRDGDAVTGAVAIHLATGAPITISAKATIVATGGLTRLYRRNSASANMGGDGYALCLRAGAPLIDMEFVQFFPIGHLAPRLIGMDPIMWDPFRYKLGGRLLDGGGREFLADYGSDETTGYTTPRDIATYAIQKEVAAGRGSPHGGVYLSFTHVPRAALEAAFGPVIERLAKNGIDLGTAPIEVAPIAHYHMGGIAVDECMASRVPGLFAAGEAVGGANGANRLSGNAIPEALVFGQQAGHTAAVYAATRGLPDWPRQAGAAAIDQIRSLADGRNGDTAAGELLDEMNEVMWRDVGPFRTASGLGRAIARLDEIRTALPQVAVPAGRQFNTALAEWFELRGSVAAAQAVAHAAALRTESRGAHQREDFPGADPRQVRSRRIALARDGGLTSAARQ
jgi:succinate dehydrogenase/fumarate reductase flavoprotein subunit